MSINPYPRRFASQALAAAALCIGGSHILATEACAQAVQPAGTGVTPANPPSKVVRAKVAYTLPATKPQRAVKPLRQK